MTPQSPHSDQSAAADQTGQPDLGVTNSVATGDVDEVTGPRLLLETRPEVIYAAIYHELPFPNLGPRQDFVFDLGVTALEDSFHLVGLVVRGFAGHQMLFEQRWPERILREKSGLPDLEIPAGTGIALRAMHFQLHGYEAVTMLELTAVAKRAGATENGQAQLHVAVEHPQQRTDIHFPLEGAWWAIQAGDWSDLHKLEVISQPFAIDFVKLGPDSETFHGSGSNLEDHYSWDQPVYAAAGGKVAYAVYDMPDAQPGTVIDPLVYRGDPRRLLGNAIAISHGNGEFSFYAHLQQAGLRVRYGDLVRRGTEIARVGNSGHSPGPHLHLHLMNGPNLQLDQGLPLKISHFWAAGQFFQQPTTIPTRMIVKGLAREQGSNPDSNPDREA